MKDAASSFWRSVARWHLLAAVLFVVAGWQGTAAAFTVNVVDQNGNPITSGFRWMVEEDTTTVTTPGALVHDSVSNVVHKSYAPVVSNGLSGSSSANINVPNDKRYFVSVLPYYFQYTMSGTIVPAGATSVTVKVNDQPIPTAQISVYAFVDHAPINNAPDAGEAGLEGCRIEISDAGGPMLQDIFGNPLGTTYQQNASGAYLFDADGAPLVSQLGDGFIYTDATGNALIKNIAAGKYGIVLIPPATRGDGSPVSWVQTATIEGTPTIDAWVAPNEPQLFIEGFGTGFTHVAFGFVDPTVLPWAQTPPAGAGSITGTNVYNHFSRPPFNQGYFSGEPVPECWIGLNDSITQQGLYAAPCNADSTFAVNNVPPGAYELVTWDKALDALFGFNTVVVGDPADVTPGAPPANVDLGNVLSFRWFGTMEGFVFYDDNENGIRDPGEAGIGSQAVNLRFRNGTVYQATTTDPTGEYVLSEVFPFFKWLVAEVDFARYKATGMTTVVDYGGAVDPNDPRLAVLGQTLSTAGWDPRAVGKLHPQPQDPNDPADENPADPLSRTETGPVLTQATHLFLNQTNLIDWGKVAYPGNENGGISGIVFYAVTRAEDDPRYAAAEPWEPGVPRVQMALYQDSNRDKIIDDLNGDGVVTLADVDNHPFGDFPGTGDVDHNGNGQFDAGDAVQVGTTDSWDDNLPTGCVRESIPVIHGAAIDACADAYATWNQVRPGVFDGGYAFDSYFPGGIDSGSAEVSPLPAGNYIVQAATPPGYKLVKEEDKNVDFGDTYVPSTRLLPAACVGDDHTVAQLLSFQTDEAGNPLPGLIPIAGFDSLIPPAYAGQVRPLCDRKEVFLNNGQNAAADFYLFTDVPKAALVVGFANNDLSAEFDPTSPIFGEKSSPSWLPVAFKDWAGNELLRVYMDEFGSYTALLPSTFTMNAPQPSGVAPNMLTAVLNDPFLPDGSMDPWYDPDYSVTPWTLHYTPGHVTYLDTPLVPIAAFAGFPKGGVDGKPANGVPAINTVNGNLAGGGPLICTDSSASRTIVITSPGTVAVPNPNYDFNDPASTPTILRDFGFGTTTGTVTLNGTPITVSNWSNTSITATVPAGLTSGTLAVTRGDNQLSTELGLSLTIASCGTSVITVDNDRVENPGADFTTIQAAIDAANPGDTILVAPGNYPEMVVMYKPVHLQGSGAGSTTIIGNPNPSTKLADWHNRILALLGNDPFRANEGPGIMVLGNVAGFPFNTPSSIDGFTVLGALAGGGIDVNSDVDALTISNNEITANQGNYGGGIVLGTPDAGAANNTNIVITGNRILKNGGIQGPGGIAIYSGNPGYIIENNLIKGNFSRDKGAGIGHSGLSDGGLISYNDIVFNEVFNGANLQGVGDGGGIFVGGEVIGLDGAGNVTINGNLIQGNLVGAGKGGGIRAWSVNGTDAAATPYELDIFNNMIVNNVAGLAGGGISLQDVVAANIINNTIAHNDTSSTATAAFAPGALVSVPTPAGIESSIHSTSLEAILGAPGYSDPTLVNNIVVENRSFFYDRSANAGAGGLLPDPATPTFWDLGVTGTLAPATDKLNPQFSLLTSLTGNNGEVYSGNGNLAFNPAQPLFVLDYFNALVTAAVIDEGGNNINVKFSELEVAAGDYHVQDPSQVLNQGTGSALVGGTGLQMDFDGDSRPAGLTTDMGADQVSVTSFVAFPSQVGVFRSTAWYLDADGNKILDGGDLVRSFGITGDISIVGDWNNDGIAEIGVFRNGNWYLDTNGNGVWNAGVDQLRSFGLAGDIPVVGDWNNDGTDNIGVFRNGLWYLDTNGNGVWNPGVDQIRSFGIAGDIPVVGDWDGNGAYNIGVFRNAQWYLDTNGNGVWNAGVDQQFRFGLAGDLPVVGDWNGDGSANIGVFRSGQWYLDSNGNRVWNAGVDTLTSYGIAGDKPVVGVWQ